MTIRSTTEPFDVGPRKLFMSRRSLHAVAWLVMGAFLALSPCPVPAADPDLAGRFIESANKAIAAGKLKEAEDFLDRASAVAPQDERVRQARERLMAKKQIGEKAESEKQRAIKRTLASRHVDFPLVFRSKLPQSSDVRWDMFSDHDFIWAPDKKRGAFRRCSGDVDKPTCLLMMFELSDLRPKFVAADSASPNYPFADQRPVLFGKDFIVVNSYYSATLVEFSLNHDSVVLIADDSWGATASPDGKLIAYCTSFRTGGDLWIVGSDYKYRKPRRLTSFAESGKTCNSGDCCSHIRWSKDSRRITLQHKGKDIFVSAGKTE